MAKLKYYPVGEMIYLAIKELEEGEPEKAHGILTEAMEDLNRQGRGFEGYGKEKDSSSNN